ncbi:hypothetical protein [Roseibium aquae]|uniref:hypothetical protein n=1 Tax=Roseibium aquae TaxID=1323746 RepID=UPI00123CD70F|nr:hypothetical protein [Roseibium aquae]
MHTKKPGPTAGFFLAIKEFRRVISAPRERHCEILQALVLALFSSFFQYFIDRYTDGSATGRDSAKVNNFLESFFFAARSLNCDSQPT